MATNEITTVAELAVAMENVTSVSRKMASELVATGPDARLNVPALAAHLREIETHALKGITSHTRFVYAHSLVQQVKGALAAYVSAQDADQRAMAQDSVKALLGYLAAQMPTTIYNGEAGKREKDNTASQQMRGMKRVFSQATRLAPSYVPGDNRAALADLLKKQADRDAKRAADAAATKAIPAPEEAPSK